MAHSLDLNDRIRGALWGPLLADSLALGPHWIYDQDEIETRFGRIDALRAPATSYHPGKEAGHQTHLGDQALLLLDYIARRKAWDAEAFSKVWSDFWQSSETTSYRDKATKQTLAQLLEGVPSAQAGSPSEELAGPARAALLVPILVAAGDNEEQIVAAAEEKSALTHRSPIARATARFLAQVTWDVLHGAPSRKALENRASAAGVNPSISSSLEKAVALLAEEPRPSVLALGQSCALPGALASTFYLLLSFHDQPERALAENAQAGGDSAARGLVLGLLLGAEHGLDFLPRAWQEGLAARKRVQLAIEQVTG